MWTAREILLLFVALCGVAAQYNISVCLDGKTSPSTAKAQPYWRNLTLFNGTESITVRRKEADIRVVSLACREQLSRTNYSLFVNGEVSADGRIWKTPYCVSNYVESGIRQPRLKLCLPYEICAIMILVARLFSCIGMGITLCVYVFRRKRKTLHTKTLICYSASLFLSYFLIIFQSIEAVAHVRLTKTTCYVLSYMFKYCLLSSFSWLVVISFDIFRTFRNIVPVDVASSRRYLFTVYNLFAWGIALVPIIMSCAIGNHTQTVNCWQSNWPFVLYPVLLMLVINLILFILTARAIYLAKKATSHVLKQHTKARAQFTLYVKLFSIMGLSWLLAPIIFYSCPNTSEMQCKFAISLLNGLQGFFIAVATALKWDVIKRVVGKVREISSSSGDKSSSKSTSVLQRQQQSGDLEGHSNTAFEMQDSETPR